MPAVTVEDLTTITRVERPAPGARARAVRRVVDAPRALEGEGFPVRRAFHGVAMAELDPFVHMDQMGEVLYAPGEPKGTPWHPHRGFETVTYMIDGTFQHRDSIGGGGLIENGGTQWMTAGSGILHIERPPEALVATGGLFHGVQLWVNLPSRDKMIDPRYQDITPGAVVLLASHDAGALVRVIAGRVGTVEGPGVTHTPITLVHATVAPGARLELPWDPRYNALVYALAGAGTVGEEGAALHEGQLAVLDEGDHVVVTGAPRGDGRSQALELLVLGGEPIREPVATYGPFVMNTRAELVQAFEDFEAGRLGTIPAGEG
jgi:redox-sensitive bicupin YhaK (pirin superfamily)